MGISATPQILDLIRKQPQSVQDAVEKCLEEYAALFEKYDNNGVSAMALALFGSMLKDCIQ